MALKNNKRGFTLIELIVVIAILAIIAAITVPTAFGSIENARAAACKTNETDIQSAWRLENAQEKLEATDAAYTARTQEQMLEDAIANCGVKDKYNSSAQIITNLCPSGGTYNLTVTSDGTLRIVCSKHDDPSRQAQQANAFAAFYDQWIAAHPGPLTGKEKGDLISDFYAANSVVQVPDDYVQMLRDNGFNTAVKGNLYWWTYPVTDASGNLLYTVTYANTTSTPNSWTGGGSARQGVEKGYVIVVNGKTYMTTSGGGGNIFSPGSPNGYKDYPDANTFENAIKASSYYKEVT